MRPIKFRGVRIDNGEIVYGYYVKSTAAILGIDVPLAVARICHVIIADGEFFHIKPETVGQFTDLLDSQGVEIWEGDVVRWDDASKGRYWRVAEVVWHEVGAWCYRTIPGLCAGALTSYSADFKMGSFIYTPDSSKYGNVLEVLGNVHQNPELLK